MFAGSPLVFAESLNLLRYTFYMKVLFLLILTTVLSVVAAVIMFSVFKLYAKTDFKEPKPIFEKTCQVCTGSKELDLLDFDVLLVSESKPHTVIYINHLDNKVENYAQTQLTYSLDGKNIKTSLVPFNDVTWHQITTNSSNLEYSLSGTFKVNGETITFSIPSVFLTMSIRAQPDVGKFGGSLPAPTATISVNGKELESYAAVTAGFFTKFTPVDTKDLGVSTDWIMAFDNNWNFMHLDKSEMTTSTSYYYPHTFMAVSYIETNNINYLTDAFIFTPTDKSLFVSGFIGTSAVLNHNYTLVDSVNPYRGATLSLIEEDLGGVGFHLKLSN